MRLDHLADGTICQRQILVAEGFSPLRMLFVLFSGGIDSGLGDRGGYPESYFKKSITRCWTSQKFMGSIPMMRTSIFGSRCRCFLHLAGIHNHWSLPILTILGHLLNSRYLLYSCLPYHRRSRLRLFYRFECLGNLCWLIWLYLVL